MTLSHRYEPSEPERAEIDGRAGPAVLEFGAPWCGHCIAAQGPITTIEGLGTPEKMNEVQKAFVEHDGQQCGFCTPGFVTACTAFVRSHPNASLEDVRGGLGGNLCRCGTYAGIILAAVDAAKSTKGGA